MQKVKEPKCKNCWDKGYSTQMAETIGYPDFIGDKGFRSGPQVYKKYCNCAKGKRLRAKDPNMPKVQKPKKSSYKGGAECFFNEALLNKAVLESMRLQEIQMIVWDYMLLPKHKRDGIKMAMDISKLFEKK